MRTQEKSMSNRILAIMLCLVMLFGMMPTNLVTAAGLDYGTAEALTPGGVVSGDPASLVLTYESAELEWVDVDASQGRNQAGWYIGMRLHAPEALVAESDYIDGENEVTIQTKGFNGWSSTSLSFWDNQNSDMNSAEAARYIDLWFYLDESRVISGKVNGELTFGVKADWNKDGSYEQEIIMDIVPTGVTLKKNGDVVFPLTGVANISVLNSDGTINPNANIEGNGTDYVIVTPAATTYTWVAKDAAIERPQDGWWAGIRIDVPENVDTSAAQMKIGEYVATVASEVVMDADGKYIPVWKSLNALEGKTVNNASVSATNIEFDWNADGIYEQLVVFSVDHNKVTLVKDEVQAYPLYTATVTVNEGGSAVVKDTESASKVVKKGEEVVFVATANAGYQIHSINNVAYTGQDKTTAEIPVVVDENTTVEVVFEKLHTVTVDFGANGQVSVEGMEPNAGTVVVAQSEITGKLTVTATPNAGYTVTEFTVNTVPQNVANLAASVAYTAELEPADYQITVAFTDKTPATITVTTAPTEGWDNEKSFAFTVADSTGSSCVVYVCELDLAAFQTALEEGTLTAFTELYYTVAEDISNVGKNFYIYAVDPAGNIAQETVAVKQVDTQTPIVGDVDDYKFGGKYNRKIRYHFAVTDAGGSAISQVVYTTSESGENAQTASYNNYTGEWYFDVKADETQYYIFAYDNAGNVTKVEPQDEAPEISDIDTPTEWVADQYEVEFAVTYNGDSCYVYWSDTEYERVSDVKGNATELTLDEGNYRFSVDKNDTYYVYAIDADNNMGSVPVVINRIDNTDPTVNELTTDHPSWTNGQVVLSGSVSDEQADVKVEDGQPKIVDVRYSTVDTYSKNTSQSVTNFNAETGAYSFVVDTEDETILNNTYYVWALDEVGHVSAAEAILVRIDKVNPIGTVSVNKHTTTWSQIFENLTFGIYRNEEVTVTIAYSDKDQTNSGMKSVLYYDANIATTEGLNIEALDAAYTAGKFRVYESNVIISEDRQFAVYFRLEDVAGNVTYLNSDGVILDTTLPLGEISVEKWNAETEKYEALTDNWVWNTFAASSFSNNYSDTALKISVDAWEDEESVISGIKSVSYYKSHDILTREQIKSLAITDWTQYTTPLEYTDNARLVLYIRIEDNAGNFDYISTNGIVVDNKEPSGAETEETHIVITPEDDNLVKEFEIYKDDVTVSITVFDPKYTGAEGNTNGDFSGLKEITYKVYTTDTDAKAEGILYKANLGAGEQLGDLLLVEPNNTEKNPVITADPATKLVSTWSGKIVIPAATFNSNNVVVEITAVDNADNTRTTYTNAGEIKIDVQKPTIEVDYDNNSPDGPDDNKTFFKADRTATITVTERNFNQNAVTVNITKDGKPYTDYTLVWKPGVAGTGNGDDATQYATIPFNNDGDYTISVSCKDAAENPNEEPVIYQGLATQAFTIDKILPTVKVEYNNNSVTNEKYFNAVRTATITIVEHNFDRSRVTFSQTANRGGTVPNVTWNSEGDTHKATFSYTVDGDYTFDVTMKDLAGNESAAANYGSSVAGKDFIIDTTYEDMISQEGVENGAAYGHDAEVIPNIKISDINLQEYTVTLTGVQKDKTIDLTTEVNALLSKGAETVTGIFDIFETKQDLDGIYTLKMTSKDKAGNEDSMEIVFTVNRFGSVYVFEDYLLNLVKDNGAFVQKVDSDLVITEFNADRLVADSLKIEITVDGKPLENVQYTVTPEINDTVSVGSSGWYQYKYTISKDNFTADGVYKISVSSEDATGNTPENSNYEDMGMNFRVDSTKSEISSVVGLEEAIINAQEVTVKYTVFDTIGIKSIVVYVDGKPVDEITDFTADPNNYSGSFTLTESSSAQKVRIVVEDMAGNITDTNAEDFAPAYEFNGSVTVSTNIFVRWYANKPLFWGSIGGVVVVAGALWFFLASKKKKKEEATAK